MMFRHAVNISEDGQRALDVIEDLISTNDWPYERMSSTEMQASIKGRWSEYHMYFIWQEEFSALQFCCQINIQMPGSDAHKEELALLLKGINENLWLGHFDICKDEQLPSFRYTSLFRGSSQTGPSIEQIEDLLDIAVAECDRFYPCFQMMSTGVVSASQSITGALLDPAGEA